MKARGEVFQNERFGKDKKKSESIIIIIII